MHQDGGQKLTPNGSIHDTNLYKVAWNATTNIWETMYLTDLRIDEVIYKFVSYNIPRFWLISSNSFDFILLLRDSENDL